MVNLLNASRIGIHQELVHALAHEESQVLSRRRDRSEKRVGNF